MTIRHYNLTNCITIVDRNHCMIDGNTEDVMKLEPLADKFVAFGFHTIVCEGNNIVSLCKAIDEAHKTKDKPTVIVADTIKGVRLSLQAVTISGITAPLMKRWQRLPQKTLMNTVLSV